MTHAPQSFGVASTLAAQRIVAISAANTVGYPASRQVLPIGVTDDTVLDTNASIPVLGPGSIARVLFNDTVSAAGLVGSDSSGRGVPVSLADTTTSLTLAGAYAGVLSDAAVSATATIARIYVMPGFDRTSG